MFPRKATPRGFIYQHTTTWNCDMPFNVLQTLTLALSADILCKPIPSLLFDFYKQGSRLNIDYGSDGIGILRKITS